MDPLDGTGWIPNPPTQSLLCNIESELDWPDPVSLSATPMGESEPVAVLIVGSDKLLV